MHQEVGFGLIDAARTCFGAVGLGLGDVRRTSADKPGTDEPIDTDKPYGTDKPIDTGEPIGTGHRRADNRHTCDRDADRRCEDGGARQDRRRTRAGEAERRRR